LLDRLYAQAVAARRRYYERHPRERRRLRQPVVSIGNISVGGTGKTPLVIAIAAWLLARGERPAVLSRGYARRERPDGVIVVSDGARVVGRYDEAGDEPVMMARALPGAVVAVAEDRHLAGTLAERRLGATVHVLDDGFQHVQLARDLDVLMTSAGEVTGGRVLPFGRLREAAGAAARADVVVVMDADLPTARLEAWALGVSQVAAARRRVAPGDGAVFAVAGIGNPDQFFASLREAGYQVLGTRAFPDHHRYTRHDVTAIAEAMRASGAESVATTAKDAIRFEAAGESLPMPIVTVPMTLAIDGWDDLTACVAAAIDRRRSGTSGALR
jgi:tetraacyldisaccharide 4'-kinase